MGNELNNKMKPHPDIILIILNKLMLIISMLCSLCLTQRVPTLCFNYTEKKSSGKCFWSLLNDFNAIYLTMILLIIIYYSSSPNGLTLS